MPQHATPGATAPPAPNRGETPPSLAGVVAGFVVSLGITVLALAFGPSLLATWGPLLAWLATAAALTVGTVLFSALVPPPVMAARPRLVMTLGFVGAAVFAVGGILLRRRLGLGTYGIPDLAVFVLAVLAAYATAKALARAGVTDRLRRF